MTKAISTHRWQGWHCAQGFALAKVYLPQQPKRGRCYYYSCFPGGINEKQLPQSHSCKVQCPRLNPGSQLQWYYTSQALPGGGRHGGQSSPSLPSGRGAWLSALGACTDLTVTCKVSFFLKNCRVLGAPRGLPRTRLSSEPWSGHSHWTILFLKYQSTSCDGKQ